MRGAGERERERERERETEREGERERERGRERENAMLQGWELVKYFCWLSDLIIACSRSAVGRVDL